mgnify:FL=1
MQSIIEQVWNDRELLQNSEVIESIKEVISMLNQGKLRVAEPNNNSWIVNEWIKKAILLYFQIHA